jgi:hypothetical protein
MVLGRSEHELDHPVTDAAMGKMEGLGASQIGQYA